MKRRRRKTPEYRLFSIIAIIALIAFISFAIWTDKAVRPLASVQAEHLSLIATNQAIEETASDYLAKNSQQYSDFATVIYDDSGRVSAIEAKPSNINKVQSELALEINSRLEKSGGYAEIPVGSLTGSYMLAGKGFKIRLRICPANKAEVRLKSNFTSAGNNQTCHRISAYVTAEIKSSLPIYDFATETDFEFLLAESIIVGNVPDNALYAWNEY